MTTAAALLAFVGAASILTITPGLDTALVLRSAAAGPRRAAHAAAGIVMGCLVWGALVSLGLGALLAASELAYTVLKWAGAAYLLWLGAKLLLRPRRSFEMAQGAAADLPAATFLRQGLLTNLLNPKVGVFYVTFLPQFVPAGADVGLFSFLLACIHALLGAVWLTVLISATVPMSRLLRRASVVRATDRIAGVVFLTFGARLALTK